MKIIDLLQEIEDILDSAGGFPLTGKVIVNADDISDILNEIRRELPEEIKQAQWIKDERQRILDDAKAEYDKLIKLANEKSDQLVESDDITLRAKKRADEILHNTQESVTELKMGTFEYVDQILYTFQQRITEMNDTYVQRLLGDITDLFDKMDQTIADNRAELKAMSDDIEEVEEI
ncbi:MAG: ATPase [Firmicutes bacterium]|nr:ATPase [Bacillota bacterium]